MCSKISRLILSSALTVSMAVVWSGDAAAAKKKRKPPAKPPCVSESSMPALNEYAFRTQLMTAALSCPGERERYNMFVTQRQAELVDNGAALKRALGAKTNKFVTTTANKTFQVLDCGEASDQFGAVLSEQQPPLSTLASNEWAAPRHGYVVCERK